MTLQFSTTDALDNTFLNVLLTGPSGTGKTHLLGTLTGMFPSESIIIGDAETGLLPLKGKGIPTVTIKSAADVESFLDWCEKDAVNHGIKVVALDSISEIAEKVLSDEKTKSPDPRKAYGEMADKMLKIIKRFRDLSGLHSVVVAKSTLAKDAITGVDKAVPWCPGQQIAQHLPYIFDEVLFTYSDVNAEGNKYFAIRTQSSFNVLAKDRSGKLEEVEYACLASVFTKILGS